MSTLWSLGNGIAKSLIQEGAVAFPDQCAAMPNSEWPIPATCPSWLRADSRVASK